MTQPEDSGGGWTIWRILGLFVGLMGMAGFGLCSLWGLVVTGSQLVQSRDTTVLALGAFIAPGVGLTFLFFLLVRTMIRRSRKAPRE